MTYFLKKTKFLTMTLYERRRIFTITFPALVFFEFSSKLGLRIVGSNLSFRPILLPVLPILAFEILKV
jgi:hypothetical protein